MKKIKDLKYKNPRGEIKDLSVFRYHKPRFEKSQSKNDDIFVKWVLSTIKRMTNTELMEGEKFNACSLYLNDKNNKELNKKMNPMVWLNISPTTCDELSDNEIAIDMKDVITREII